MIEFIAFFIFILFFFVLVFRNISLSIKVSSMTKTLLQSEIDKNILAEKLFESSARNIIKKDESSEAFLKFVSDSRDWAYSYIESVQEEINSFITLVGPDIEYLDSYKPPIISEEVTDRLIVGYKKIKDLLPKDYGKIDT
jgi:hypothetical protein